MEREYTYDLPGPHWDAEWDCLRGNIRYWLTVPSNGIDENTGLIIFIPGYGMEGDGEYAKKFRSFISDRFNCCVASFQTTQNHSSEKIQPAPDFYLKLKEHHSVHGVNSNGSMSGADIVRGIMQALKQRGVNVLHPECNFLVENSEHHSFGLLPAIDALGVVNDVLKRHDLNKKRLFSLGSSYGGYINGLLLKLAPNTFRMLIDNSGFVNSDDDLNGLYGISGLSVAGVKIPIHYSNRWSDDPDSPQYFSQACRELRDLLHPEHVRSSETLLYSYHSINDHLVNASKKRALVDAYRGKIRYDQTIVEEQDLDGRLFKTLEHGMNASLRGLFEISYEKYLTIADTAMDATDFDLKSEIVLPCSGRTYVAYYGDDGVELVIH